MMHFSLTIESHTELHSRICWQGRIWQKMLKIIGKSYITEGAAAWGIVLTNEAT